MVDEPIETKKRPSINTSFRPAGGMVSRWRRQVASHRA
jgi:hypothetical protein